MVYLALIRYLIKSLSARRAWIEISPACSKKIGRLVALRKESVDRNLWWGVRKAVGSLVALRKESVDRNNGRLGAIQNAKMSLSARRAWIEIIDYIIDYVNGAVALRKESVDRNATMQIVIIVVDTSLSARRAWIEIWLGIA